MSNEIKTQLFRRIRQVLFWTAFFSPEAVAIIIAGDLWLGIITGAIKLGICCLWFLLTSPETRKECTFGPLIFVSFWLWFISALVISDIKLPVRWIISLSPWLWMLILPAAAWLLTGIFYLVELPITQEITCRVCKAHARVHLEIPYCKKCLKNSLEKTLILRREVEERIENAEKLGMRKQIEGARRYFEENLPEPIKWVLANLVVGESMLESGKTIEKVGLTPFDPKEFEKFPIDIDHPELNIPGEGLRILAKILPVKDENKNLERR
jgi:hypothetical protein